MMADYISREAVLALGYWHGERPDFDNPYPDGIDAVDTSDIETIPAADVVEVVRCGNCKSSEPIPENSGFYKGNWLHCRKWRGEFTGNVWHPKEKRWKDWNVTTPEGFCDDGEARDENKEDG